MTGIIEEGIGKAHGEYVLAVRLPSINKIELVIPSASEESFIKHTDKQLVAFF
jgi:hypothetical protein